MFKRLEKRIRKKEKEEELGLDGEMKEMLGMNDTDSDESSSSNSADDDGETRARVNFPGGASGTDADENGNEEDVGEGEESEPDTNAEEDEDEGPPMSISEALQNPLYLISPDLETKACIICPRKLLKNPIMADVHLKSNAHARRFARLREVAMDVNADTDVRELVRMGFTNPTTKKSSGSRLSKRAEKKKAKLAAIKEKRAKQKIMKSKYRAKKEARLKVAADAPSDSKESDESPVHPPASKKRKSHQATAIDDGIPAKRLKQTKPTTPSKHSKLPSKDKSMQNPKSSSKDKPVAEQSVTTEPRSNQTANIRGSTKTEKIRHREPAS